MAVLHSSLSYDWQRDVMLEGATEEGQTAHLQAGLCRCRSPMPQIRTARQGSIRSACSKHVRVIEFTGRRSDLWWASSGARPVGKVVDRVGASGCGLRSRRAASRRHRRYVVVVERGVSGQHRPQYPCALVGRRHTRAEAMVGPTPSNVVAFFGRSSMRTWLAMHSSH